jgi:hypothetical protein
MSASWLVYIFSNSISVITQDFLVLLVLILASVSFVISTFFVIQMLIDLRKEMRKTREREKNIKDIYQYDQLLDPPSMYT